MSQDAGDGPILRLFEVKTKPGRAADLIAKFATTSAAVVKGEPGNKGYFFGSGVDRGGDYVAFASVWDSLDAIKQRFGADWQVSFLPEGYDDMIEHCSIRHIDLAGGWHVTL